MRRCLGCMTELEDSMEVCPACGYEQGAGAQEPYYLQPGSMLMGKYVVGKALGHGGFGITYIGYDTLLNRKVAIKEYYPGNFVTRVPGQTGLTVYSGNAGKEFEAGLKSFISEARKLAQLTDTPEIVRIYDCFTENNTGYIIMELIQGSTVKEILSSQGKLSFSDAKYILLQVMRGLSAAHRLGIIHRDISPDNIMIGVEGKVKLLDFGAAKHTVSAHSMSLSMVLKPGYAPEEQYRTNGRQGAWTDVYGAGATLYKMVTGITPEEAIERMVDDRLVWPSQMGIELPEYAERALRKSLSIRMEDRFQTMEEFRDALEENYVRRPGNFVPQEDGPTVGLDAPGESPVKQDIFREPSGDGGFVKKIRRLLEVLLGLAAFSVVCYGGWIFYDTTVRENSEGAPSESSVQNDREEGMDSERITEKTSPLRTGSETEGGNNIVIFDHAQTENRFSPSLENENSSIYVIGEDIGESIESPQTDSETEIHRYELIRKDCSWTQAFVECQSKGGYLARIDTDEEYAYILGEIERQNMEDCKFFLGGRRDASDRKYYWVDEKNHLIGECLNNPSSWCIGEWMENEPSFSDGEIQEAYINMFYYSEEKRWVWNDIPDNILDVMPTYAGTIGFICEYEE